MTIHAAIVDSVMVFSGSIIDTEGLSVTQFFLHVRHDTHLGLLVNFE